MEISKIPKLILVLFAVLFLSGLFSPGEARWRSVRPGLKLGAGLSNIFGSDAYQQDWQPALTCGVCFTLGLSQRLGLESELLYSQKSSVYRLKLDNSEYREKYLLSYLEIPLILKFFLTRTGLAAFYVYGGPSVGFNLRARLKVTFDGLEETVEVDSLKGRDGLINLGVGAEIKFSGGFFVLESRYSQGLKSISREVEGDIRNKSLIFLFGFRL